MIKYKNVRGRELDEAIDALIREIIDTSDGDLPVVHESEGNSPRQSPLRGCGWTALLLVTVVSVWLYFGIRQSKYLLPSEGVATLEGLASATPPTRKLSVIEDQGTRYFVWIGRTPTVMLASGPPVYVFDASGNLVGRSIDIGDSGDHRLLRYFHLALEGREVAFKDALNLVNPR